MRVALAVILLASACGAPAGSAVSTSPVPSASAAIACQPTTSRDAAGVLTANGVYGVLGATSMSAAIAMNELLVIVHKGVKEQDTLSLLFNSVGTSSPATSVSYSVVARARVNPWGASAFEAGWKPIGFAGSCWQVMADGTDTGLVLFVRP